MLFTKISIDYSFFLGLKCHVGDDEDLSPAAPEVVGPVPDFVVESAGNFGKWTSSGIWDKSVKKEKKKEEKKMMRRDEDPSVPRNLLPFDSVWTKRRRIINGFKGDLCLGIVEAPRLKGGRGSWDKAPSC